jgi:hypothetical protein
MKSLVAKCGHRGAFCDQRIANGSLDDLLQSVGEIRARGFRVQSHTIFGSRGAHKSKASGVLRVQVCGGAHKCREPLTDSTARSIAFCSSTGCSSLDSSQTVFTAEMSMSGSEQSCSIMQRGAAAVSMLNVAVVCYFTAVVLIRMQVIMLVWVQRHFTLHLCPKTSELHEASCRANRISARETAATSSKRTAQK